MEGGTFFPPLGTRPCSAGEPGDDDGEFWDTNTISATTNATTKRIIAIVPGEGVWDGFAGALDGVEVIRAIVSLKFNAVAESLGDDCSVAVCSAFGDCANADGFAPAGMSPLCDDPLAVVTNETSSSQVCGRPLLNGWFSFSFR